MDDEYNNQEPDEGIEYFQAASTEREEISDEETDPFLSGYDDDWMIM